MQKHRIASRRQTASSPSEGLCLQESAWGAGATGVRRAEALPSSTAIAPSLREQQQAEGEDVCRVHTPL